MNIFFIGKAHLSFLQQTSQNLSSSFIRGAQSCSPSPSVPQQQCRSEAMSAIIPMSLPLPRDILKPRDAAECSPACRWVSAVSSLFLLFSAAVGFSPLLLSSSALVRCAAAEPAAASGSSREEGCIHTVCPPSSDGGGNKKRRMGFMRLRQVNKQHRPS